MARMRCTTALTGVLCALVLLAQASALQARELAMDPEEMIPVELATVGVDPVSGTPLVLLREPESGDVVPISIGVAEARAILMALEGTEPPRPQTHDLIGGLLGALDAELERVLVDDLDEGIYYGMLELRVAGRDEPLRVDSRPSDALALAARTGASIRVAPEILLDAEGRDFEGLEDDQVVTALGITVVEATAELREALGLPDTDGVIVSGARGHAAHMGLSEGSLITEVNGETPEAPMEFLDLVRATPEDEPAQITYWQDGETHEIDVPTDVPETDDEEGITL